MALSSPLIHGRHLSTKSREFFEDLFNASLRRVCVGFDGSPRRYGALAFASGDSIVMVPEIAAAKPRALASLLAHELTHVVQQRRMAAAGQGSALELLDDPELEMEARAVERTAIAVIPCMHPGALFDHTTAPVRLSAVLQCASAGYSTLSMPDEKISGGLRYFQNEKLKEGFREAIENYIRLIPPLEVGVYEGMTDQIARKQYVAAIQKRFETKPYLLKELIAAEKVMYSDLSPSDKKWVQLEIGLAWDRIRKNEIAYTKFTSRIIPDHVPSWMDFRTVDCVFAAILRTLTKIETARVDPRSLTGNETAKSATVTARESSEAEMEAWLAEYFKVGRRVTPDVQIIHLIEHDLGWKNLADVEKFSDLKAGEYKGKAYIVSYEKTAGTQSRDAFWHTVYVEIASNGKAEITDRQATGMGIVPNILDTASCDAWMINKETEGYKELKKGFTQKFG